jgi:hypothetical protein
MPACLKCGSKRVVAGKIASTGDGKGAVFEPRSLRIFTITIYGGTRLTKEAFACRDCGLVWSSTSPAQLEKFLKRHCDEPEE